MRNSPPLRAETRSWTKRPFRSLSALDGAMTNCSSSSDVRHTISSVTRACMTFRHRVDEVVRHQVRDVRDGHPLLHRALHPRQAHAELVLEQLADGPDAAIAEVVDVVGRLGTELNHEEVADHRHDVLAAQRLDGERRVDLQLLVDHEPPDASRVTAPRGP